MTEPKKIHTSLHVQCTGRNAGSDKRRSDIQALVTCRRCLFMMLVEGYIRPDDPRITAEMRARIPGRLKAWAEEGAGR